MKINIILLTLLFICSLGFSQTRYIDEIFDEVKITHDVVYGNAPDLPFWFWVESNTQDIDLDMDIYEPEGDTEESRPVILLFHTGSFFSGHNELDDVVEVAIASAKRGYVAISVNYRLGINILSQYSGERAVYRGLQDAGAAIRYLREFHEVYKINPEEIFMWGSSAGAFIGLHLAYSDEDERPESTYGGGGDPDLGCIECSGNDYNQNSRPNALVSCWGAIGNLDWIDPDDMIPTIMFHGDLDPVVPFDSGYPFTIDITLGLVYGSNLIHAKLNEYSILNELHVGEGEIHEYWGAVNGNWFDGPNDNYYQIINDSYNFLYPLIDTESDIIIGDLNQDNTVNVLDVIEAVNYILNDEYLEEADLNEDGYINVSDIILLINIIL